MVVGWQLADHMSPSIVVDALQMAVTSGHIQQGALFHSDRGAQGGFNPSSQHLDDEESGWDDHEAGRRDDHEAGRRLRLGGRRCLARPAAGGPP